MDFIFELIRKALTGIVDSFKMKNPVVFTVVAGVLATIYFGLGNAIDATLPDGTPWLQEAAVQILETVRTGIVFLLTLFGAHTPQSTTAKAQ